MRLCLCGCGADLDQLGMRSDAIYASQACKMRHRRGKQGKSARQRPSRNKAVTGSRPPTRYAVIPAAQLQPVATVEAHDRETAARLAGSSAPVVAVPERSLKQLQP